MKCRAIDNFSILDETVIYNFLQKKQVTNEEKKLQNILEKYLYQKQEVLTKDIIEKITNIANDIENSLDDAVGTISGISEVEDEIEKLKINYNIKEEDLKNLYKKLDYLEVDIDFPYDLTHSITELDKIIS